MHAYTNHACLTLPSLTQMGGPTLISHTHAHTHTHTCTLVSSYDNAAKDTCDGEGGGGCGRVRTEGVPASVFQE